MLLIIKGTNIEEQLARLLPLVVGKNAAIVVTFRDKVLQSPDLFRMLDRLRTISGLAVQCVDARRMSQAQRDDIFAMLRSPKKVGSRCVNFRFDPPPAVRRSWFEASLAGGPPPPCACFAGRCCCVLRQSFRQFADPFVQAAVQPAITYLSTAPSLVREVMVGRYGLVTMGR